MALIVQFLKRNALVVVFIAAHFVSISQFISFIYCADEWLFFLACVLVLIIVSRMLIHSTCANRSAFFFGQLLLIGRAGFFLCGSFE